MSLAADLQFLRMSERPNFPRKKDTLVSLARYSEMGFIIPAAVLLGFFLGKLADYWLHTKWLYLVGLLFGAVVGFWQMIRVAVGAYHDAPQDEMPQDEIKTKNKTKDE
jgi:F0F1-type ATP synthase assembly protein I